MVRLAATWLTDFDSNARRELSNVLARLAESQPQATAEQLGHTGGFQKLAVFAALRKWSAKTLPIVVNQLNVAERRANAVEYLASVGAEAGPLLERKLQEPDREVRLAAADALGKIGFRPSATSVRTMYDQNPGDRSQYLTSLANLGDPKSESLFADLLRSPATSESDRASSFLGLSRIGTMSSISVLASEARKSPPDKKEILEALSVAGDQSLEQTLPALDLLEVAGGINSRRADEFIATALLIPTTRTRAAELSVGRPGLAIPLARALATTTARDEGQFVDRAVRALASTLAGRKAFEELGLANRYRGFMQRELALAR